MQLLLLGNLFLDTFLLEESFLIGNECLDVTDLRQIIVMSRLIGPRAAYIGCLVLYMLAVLGGVRFDSPLLRISLHLAALAHSLLAWSLTLRRCLACQGACRGMQLAASRE